MLGAAASLLNAYAAAHSDFTDPKGPLLTPPDSHIPQGYQGEAFLGQPGQRHSGSRRSSSPDGERLRQRAPELRILDPAAFLAEIRRLIAQGK